MTKFFMALFSLLLVAACDVQTRDRAAASSHAPSHKKALPVIAISGSEIKINGTTVWLGDTFDAWKRVLGGAPTCHKASIVTCVWHSNGLSLGSDHIDKTKVKFMLLDVAFEPVELGKRAPSWPQSPFRGTIELDDIPIYASTAFRDLLRRVPAARQLRCGGSDCGNPSAAFSDGANIHLNLDGRSEHSHILRFSISCSSTASCASLMPNRLKK